MKHCDICGKQTNELTALKEVLTTKDIKEICNDCDKLIHTQYWNIRELGNKLTNNLVVRFLEKLKEGSWKK